MPVGRSRWSDPLVRERIVVALILFAGWAVAGAVYVSAPPPLPESAELDDMEHTKLYLRDVEVIGGKAGVFTAQLNAWVASLWEGRTRAYTIAVLTPLAAGAYVFLRRAARPLPPGERGP